MLTAMTSPLPMAVTCAFVSMGTWDVRGWNVLLKVRYTHDHFRQHSEVGETRVPVGNSSINPKSLETFSHAPCEHSNPGSNKRQQEVSGEALDHSTIGAGQTSY